jgi:MFS family permease
MRKRWIVFAPLAILGMALFIGVGGFVVQHLWNWLLPPIFDWRQITFWQALGLLVLCRILFGGFGGHRSVRSNVRRRMSDRVSERMADRMADRWDHMTPEERERFSERMRGRWGFGAAATGEGQRQ